MRIIPKSWKDFQHYKDRGPSWIKLHKRLLDDYEFQCLPVASRALAPMLWLLASEYADGVIVADIKKLCFRLRIDDADFMGALNALVENGFFAVEHDASKPLAACKREAIPEKRREEVQVETQVEEEGEKIAASTAPSALVPASPKFIAIPTNVRDEEFLVSEADVSGYAETYPAVDIRQELREMRRWSMDNPKKRKTVSGIPRFINAWLSKEQDKPRNGQANRNGSPKHNSITNHLHGLALNAGLAGACGGDEGADGGPFGETGSELLDA